MDDSSTFKVQSCRNTESMLIVEPDGHLQFLCSDDYYNGTLSVEESEKLARAILARVWNKPGCSYASLLPKVGHPVGPSAVRLEESQELVPICKT